MPADRGALHREQFNALVGAYPGIVISDRWNGFEHLEADRRQVCWSHIQRDFRRHAEALADQKTFGEQGLQLSRQVFKAWRAFKHEHHDRDRLAAEIEPIQTELRQLLEDASPNSRRIRWHRRFANNLLKAWPALWTFVTIEGVEPTNNPGERALRAPVIHRKVSLGTQSKDGERFAERALSAAATCRTNPLTVHLPQRTAHRPQPRRPIPRAHLRPPTTERLQNHRNVALCAGGL